MSTRRSRQALRAWLFLGALAVLTLALGAMQYRWLGELSLAERERLRDSLDRSLKEVADAIDSHVTAECLALLPDEFSESRSEREQAYTERFLAHRDGPHSNMFRSLWIATPADGQLSLVRLDSNSKTFAPAEWPNEWAPLRRQLEGRAFGGGPGFGGPGGPGGPPPGELDLGSTQVIEIPVFAGRRFGGPRFGGPRGPGGGGRPPRAELEWLLLELDTTEFASELVPTLVKRYAGEDEYDMAVVLARDPSKLIWGTPIKPEQADASVRLFDIRFDRLMNRTRGRRDFHEPHRRPQRPAGADGRGSRGLWTLLVRHRAGSLDALVDNARHRNMAVSFSILLLISGAGVALIRFTRRAQTLADLQMEFVAGVSHELRTPLSVMRTAGHNLRGPLSGDTAKVQRYGELIEAESEKLRNIVDQILAFANARAGRAINTAELLSVPELLEQALAEEERVIASAGCSVEREIENSVPLVNGDPITLRQAFRNLLSNAAKYGAAGGLIRVSAAQADDGKAVEVRVEDRGPGIEREDIDHIFDPFYRGRGALEAQIHGTGLGLSLTKKIVEAHRGSITVASKPGEGAAFVLRLPSTGQYDDLAHTAG